MSSRSLSILLSSCWSHFTCRSNLLADVVIVDLSQAIALGGNHLEKLPSPRNERFEGAGSRIRERTRLRPDAISEQRQDLGIDPVRLGHPTDGACEVTNLTGIHDGDAEAGRSQRRGNVCFVTAGGFENDRRRP